MVLMSDLTDAEPAFLPDVLDMARHGRTAQLRAAIQAGAPVDLAGSEGDTLLILAAYHGHADAVRALLDAGADTERMNDHGQTALGAAVFKQSFEIVAELLAAGADPHGGARTPIQIAEHFDMPRILEQLRSAPPPPL